MDFPARTPSRSASSATCRCKYTSNLPLLVICFQSSSDVVTKIGSILRRLLVFPGPRSSTPTPKSRSPTQPKRTWATVKQQDAFANKQTHASNTSAGLQSWRRGCPWQIASFIRLLFANDAGGCLQMMPELDWSCMLQSSAPGPPIHDCP